VDNSEGVDIEKRTDRLEYRCPVLGCFVMELTWLVALSERGFGQRTYNETSWKEQKTLPFTKGICLISVRHLVR
jgi:hypothetical protein